MQFHGMILRIALAAFAMLGLTIMAHAHPHVTVVAKSALILDEQGRITGVRHRWTFDEAYSSFAITGMKTGADGKVEAAALVDLAKLNVESLSEFEYFTTLKQGSKKLAFNPPRPGYGLEQEGNALVLNFILPLKAAVAPTSSTTLRVDDETFFVAFSFDDKDPVRFEGQTRCKIDIKRPAKAADAGMAKLGEEFFNNLKTGFTDDFASTVKLQCP